MAALYGNKNKRVRGPSNFWFWVVSSFLGAGILAWLYLVAVHVVIPYFER